MTKSKCQMSNQAQNPNDKKFIMSLEKQTIAKLLRIIDLLEKFGKNLGLPHR